MKEKYRELSLEESKTIMLKLLDCFVLFCDENELRYSLTAGTLLGAIRHKGFIPWDDDIDVMMPREDYKIFIKKYPNWVKKKKMDIRLVNSFSCGFYMFFSKIIASNTVVVQTNRTEKIGIWIDVFPVDYVTNQNYESYNDMVYYANELYYLGSTNYFVKRKEGRLFKNIPISLTNYKRACVRFFKKRYLLRKHYSFIKNHSGEKAMCFYFPKVIKIWSQISNVRFDNLIDAPFEGKYYKIINNFDEYLTVHYGDYNILPPLEERITHSCQIKRIRK